MGNSIDVECALLWELARRHGWSAEVRVGTLVSDANVQDEQQGRDVARNQLAGRPFVGYHQGRDTIWLDPPPSDAAPRFLNEECGYTELQIEATFDSYFDGFD